MATARTGGEVAGILDWDDEVAQCAVVARDDATLGKRLVADAVPSKRTGKAANDPDQHHRVADLQSVFNTLYAGGGGQFGENFAGWQSSYDGKPIPLQEMREWRNARLNKSLR